MADTHGWKARVIETADDLMMNRQRLFLWLPRGDGSREVVMEDGHRETVLPGMMAPAGAGVSLPLGCWDAICEIATPGHSREEVKRLEEALAVERARVDNVMAVMLETAPTDMVQHG